LLLLLCAISAGSLLTGRSVFGEEAITGTEAMADKEQGAPKKSYQCALPMNDAQLREKLSPEQYRVLKQNGTEAPFMNALWNNKKRGLYVDPISGEPLFISSDKFDSGTGWPSFTRPIDPDKIQEKSDASHGTVRTEVRSQSSDSHLGHVFDDGPQPTGLRYCINSAALHFVPLEDLEKEGYGKYRELFEP
jgi:methionine-R-sulfoxide reductase